MAIKYNKLVRDKIPEIIEASGKNCVTEILTDDQYLQMLDAKLDEELAEYHQEQNLEARQTGGSPDTRNMHSLTVAAECWSGLAGP